MLRYHQRQSRVLWEALRYSHCIDSLLELEAHCFGQLQRLGHRLGVQLEDEGSVPEQAGAPLRPSQSPIHRGRAQTLGECWLGRFGGPQQPFLRQAAEGIPIRLASGMGPHRNLPLSYAAY